MSTFVMSTRVGNKSLYNYVMLTTKIVKTNVGNCVSMEILVGNRNGLVKWVNELADTLIDLHFTQRVL